MVIIIQPLLFHCKCNENKPNYITNHFLQIIISINMNLLNFTVILKNYTFLVVMLMLKKSVLY